MKKILFVNSSLTSGGSERVMSIIANEFSKRDYIVDMVLLYNYGYDSYPVSEKVNLIRFNCEHKIKIIKKIRQFRELRKVLKSNKYDCVISFLQNINIITLLANIGLKNEIIVSERCNPKARKAIIPKKIANILYLRSKKIVFQTQQVKEFFSRKIQNKSIVIPNPVNESLPEPFLGKRTKRVVGIGRLTEQKNFKLLIDGFYEFQKTYKDYTLEIYGDGPLLQYLNNYCIEKQISDIVTFKGYIKDIVNEIRDAAMFVSTSNFEGISNAMIEAMAMGIPSICTDCPVGGARLMIKNNKNGILIPVGDCAMLVQAMKKIADNPDFAKKLSLNSIKVKKDFSAKKITDAWQKIIEE